MTSHATLPPPEAAHRLAIPELIDAYAHCADRRDAKGQMVLFTPDARFLAFYDPTTAEPSQALHGRESLAPVFDTGAEHHPLSSTRAAGRLTRRGGGPRTVKARSVAASCN